MPIAISFGVHVAGWCEHEGSMFAAANTLSRSPLSLLSIAVEDTEGATWRQPFNLELHRLPTDCPSKANSGKAELRLHVQGELPDAECVWVGIPGFDEVGLAGRE